MGIFDVFTGAPAQQASAQNKGILQYVDTLGRNDISGAADTGAGFLNTGFNNARWNIGAGTDAALGYLNPLASKYGGATTLGLNALGVNGQAGTDAARSAFTTSPGYDFNLMQGLEAINRRRAAGGMLDSGNADREAQTFGAGLASNEYNNWLSKLLGFTQPELAATTGAAGVAGNRGTALAGLDTGQGSTLANLYTNAANARTGLDTKLVDNYTGQNTNQAQAELQGSKNLWGLGLAAAQAAAGMPPTGMGSSGSSSFLPSQSFLNNSWGW